MIRLRRDTFGHSLPAVSVAPEVFPLALILTDMSLTSESLAEMVSAALAQPTDFPPFSRVAVADDRLAIAMSAEAAQWTMLLPAILSAISDLPLVAVDVVLASDTSPDDFEALRQSIATTSGGERQLPVKLERHQGEDRTALAYIAADQTDHPVYVARSLADADLVLPVVVQSASDVDPRQCGLFPGFVDTAAIIRSQENGDARPSPSVAWSLGVQMRLAILVDDQQDLVAIDARAIPADWS